MLKKLIVSSSIIFATALIASEEANIAPEEAKKQALDIDKVSQAFGHLIGNNLTSLGFDFDMDLVMQGIKESMAGTPSPLSETETVQAISLVQEDAFKKLSQKNLQEANEFLAKEAKAKGVISMEEGKLLYQVEQEGSGAVVESHHSPLIKYTGKFLDGKVFGASEESERISLDETIQGFTKGIVGMKEGEKRTLYIHPELAYGETGYLPPNSMLTFEIEVVKADAPEASGETLTSIQQLNENNIDIAVPDFEESAESVR